MWLKLLARLFARLLLLLLFAGLLGAALTRYAPGFGIDEQELDTRLTASSVEALRNAHADERNILSFYVHYLSRALHGDFGTSQTFRRPVSELFLQRMPVTFRSVGFGLLAGWALSLAMAFPSALGRHWKYDVFSTGFSGLFLSLPSAAIALFFLYFGGSPGWAIGLVIFPRIFRFSRNLIVKTYALPHIISAKARGLSSFQILFWHVLPLVAPQLLALAGVSLSMGVGAAIPIEVVCDSPGIGQLAWQAALGRDLPLLVNITLLIAFLTLAATSVADFASRTLGRPLA